MAGHVFDAKDVKKNGQPFKKILKTPRVFFF
jgi:hypothetical protein